MIARLVASLCAPLDMGEDEPRDYLRRAVSERLFTI